MEFSNIRADVNDTTMGGGGDERDPSRTTSYQDEPRNGDSGKERGAGRVRKQDEDMPKSIVCKRI